MSDGIAQQVETYGAPLGQLVHRITDTLSISQARAAQVLGMSAPMLSQLVTGSRVKIGNPRAIQRLESLLALCDDVDRGLPQDQAAPRVDSIAQQASTGLTQRGERPPHDAEAVQLLIRSVASGRELRQAAELLQSAHPALAEMLLVYGVGGSTEAELHFNEATGQSPNR